MIKEINEKYRLSIYEILKCEFGVQNINDNPFSQWIIYEINEELVGFINYDLIYDRAEIEYIYVLPEFRKNKIATKLLNQMEKNLIENNIFSITLEVNINNNEALLFYKKNNFKEVTIRKNYYGSNDAIIMMKSWWLNERYIYICYWI